MANYIIIGNKKIDMDKAKKLAEYQFGMVGDVHYVHKVLYISPKGSFFVIGEGGPASEFGRKVASNTVAGGERKYFVSKKEALELAEEWGAPADTIIKYFNDLLEEA